MVFLFGLTTEKFAGGWETSEVRVLVATFETKEMAEEYVQRSIVKNQRRPYHPASVLGAYTDYEIVDFEEIPYNPEKNW